MAELEMSRRYLSTAVAYLGHKSGHTHPPGVAAKASALRERLLQALADLGKLIAEQTGS
jgi:hypothetical protein